jgi:hypothetical protein
MLFVELIAFPIKIYKYTHTHIGYNYSKYILLC